MMTHGTFTMRVLAACCWQIQTYSCIAGAVMHGLMFEIKMA